MQKTNLTHNDSINQLRDDLSRQQSRIRELEHQLADAANGKLPAQEQLDPDLIWTESIVSSSSGEPVVVLRWFTHLAQLNVEQARDLAFALLDTAEAAKSDAFLVSFGKETIGIKEPENIGKLLLAFRQFRAEAGK